MHEEKTGMRKQKMEGRVKAGVSQGKWGKVAKIKDNLGGSMENYYSRNFLKSINI